MAIQPRTIKNKRDANGVLTGRPGKVYDVYIKYMSPEGRKSYVKRGFSTRKDAAQHEAEMKTKLQNPGYSPINVMKGKQSVKDFLEEWIENYGKANLRPSTYTSYKGHIKNHIIPIIGHVQLRAVTPAMLDKLFQTMTDKGLAQNTVRNLHRVLSVSFETARKYRYIEHNPARDTITRFGKQAKTPDPYTVEQVRQFMGEVSGTQWEFPVALAGMYGLRMGEIIGMRWSNVDLENMVFGIVEQMPFKLPVKTKTLTEMAPTKSHDRTLPITEAALPYFIRQFESQEQQKALIESEGGHYYDNDLVVAKPDGAPHRVDYMSAAFGKLMDKSAMPSIRFHDLRHTAATNMHQLTGDFYTVGEILGHTLKGIGIQLGISSSLDAVTARYVDVRLERKWDVLDTYHKAIHADSKNLPSSKPPTASQTTKKKRNEPEL
jgi:integrase